MYVRWDGVGLGLLASIEGRGYFPCKVWDLSQHTDVLGD